MKIQVTRFLIIISHNLNLICLYGRLVISKMWLSHRSNLRKWNIVTKRVNWIIYLFQNIFWYVFIYKRINIVVYCHIILIPSEGSIFFLKSKIIKSIFFFVYSYVICIGLILNTILWFIGTVIEWLFFLSSEAYIISVSVVLKKKLLFFLLAWLIIVSI